MRILPETSSNIPLTFQLYLGLNKAKLLSKFILFQRIKYINILKGKRDSDLNGGFLSRASFLLTAQKLGISVHTLRQRVADFSKLGWMRKTFSGHKLISWRKIADKYALGIKKIRYFAENKLDLINILAYHYIRRNIKQQIHRKNIQYRPGALKKISQALSVEPEYSLSVRTIASVFGYLSPSTGSRIEHKVRRLGLIRIQKRERELCPSEQFASFLKYHPEVDGRVFKRDGIMFERLCNNLIPKRLKPLYIKQYSMA